MIRCDPKLLLRPVFGKWAIPVEVADFTEGYRPAVRVGCHCRNCGWRGEARVRVREDIPIHLRCPKCERLELSAHDGYLGRDERTQEEDVAAWMEWSDEMRKSIRTE
jgi:hypothetical protein